MTNEELLRLVAELREYAEVVEEPLDTIMGSAADALSAIIKAAGDEDPIALIEAAKQLPVTADGVRVQNRMDVWLWTEEKTLLLDAQADTTFFIGRGDSGRSYTCEARKCYSTKAAAEAAREREGE